MLSQAYNLVHRLEVAARSAALMGSSNMAEQSDVHQLLRVVISELMAEAGEQ